MTDVKWVFEKAIHLMDEQSEEDGATLTDDTEEYKNRTPSILTVLCADLYTYSSGYKASENGMRPIPPMLTDFENSEIPLDDAICRGILPYGLAAHLLLGEDNTKASFFNQKYEELKAAYSRKSTAVWEDIPFQFM